VSARASTVSESAAKVHGVPEPPDKDTPPTGSARLNAPPAVPTVKTLSHQIVGIAGQLHGARGDIDTVLEWQKAMATDLKAVRTALLGDPRVLHISTLPSPGSLMPPPSSSSINPPAPRPSMAVKAGKTTAQVAPWVLVLLGLVSEIAARHTAHGGAFSAILKLVFPDAVP